MQYSTNSEPNHQDQVGSNLAAGVLVMADYVRHIEATEVHGRFEIRLDFLPKMNVLYGRNGSGKTTLLHIIANILNGSLKRFAFLRFRTIKLTTGAGRCFEVYRESDSLYAVADGMTTEYSISGIRNEFSRGDIEERQSNESSELDRSVFPGAFYFPAFRTIMEAYSDEMMRRRYGPLEPRYRADWRLPRDMSMTRQARRVFGEFVPDLRYPSPAQIAAELSSRATAAAYRVVNKGQASLSEAFLGAFAAITGKKQPSPRDPNELLTEIRGMLEELNRTRLIRLPDGSHEDVYDRLRDMMPTQETGPLSETAARVLAVYRESLEQRIRVQREEFAPFERYMDAVNDFLENKRLVLISDEAVSHRVPVTAAIEFEDGSRTGLGSLSSGERQIVSMIYAATYLSGKDGVVLIDEPEISLHVDWQRLLLRRMAQQLGERQIIVCTHAPEIAADYEDELREIKPTLRAVPLNSQDDSEEDESEANPQ